MTDAPTSASENFAASPVWRQLLADPHKADLFSLLRWLDARNKASPLLGRAARPNHEAIRLGQMPSLAFAAATIAGISSEENGRPRITINSFGLFGPNGPLPLHLTEHARDRLRRVGDDTLIRFADLFHHRLILLFYRAWADSQPTASLDRPDTDRFTNYIASLTGYGQPALRSRDEVPDHAKFSTAPHLVRQTRNPEGLAGILAQYLRVPVVIQEFVPHWMRLEPAQQSRLGGGNSCLGKDAIAGAMIPDAQHKMRIRIGPMSLTRYRSLLPGQKAANEVLAWIRNYVGLEFFVDRQLVLDRAEVTAVALGGPEQLGWTSWLGKWNSDSDADDLVIESE